MTRPPIEQAGDPDQVGSLGPGDDLVRPGGAGQSCQERQVGGANAGRTQAKIAGQPGRPRHGVREQARIEEWAFVCRQTQVTVAFDELPFWQPLIPGTAAHQWSIHRRSNVESAFSHIKDEATQSVRRGDIRVMGIAKVTLAVLLNAMAANLAEVARWRERSTGVRSLDDARERKARKPRRITIKREADKPRRAEARAKHAAEKEAAKARLQAVSDEFENPPGGGYAPPSV